MGNAAYLGAAFREDERIADRSDNDALAEAELPGGDATLGDGPIFVTLEEGSRATMWSGDRRIAMATRPRAGAESETRIQIGEVTGPWLTAVFTDPENEGGGALYARLSGQGEEEELVRWTGWSAPAGDDRENVDEIAAIHDAELRRRLNRNGKDAQNEDDGAAETPGTASDDADAETAASPQEEPPGSRADRRGWRDRLSALRGILIDKAELISALERAERRVYDTYTFQINIDDDTYTRKRETLDSVAVTVLDYEESQANKEAERLLPGTFTASEAAHDRRIKASGGERPTKRFDFKWMANHNVRSAIVGDIGAAVLRWRLGQKESGASYEQETIDQADPERVAEVAALRRKVGLWILMPGAVRARTILAIETLLGSDEAEAAFDLIEDDASAGSQQPADGDAADKE